jgi:PAS domain S-box-containing protein
LIFFIVAIYLGNKNFILFHTIVEIFCIIIGFVMAIISINTYKLNKDNRIIFLGIAFGFIACINLIHLFAYMEMNVNSVFTFNSAIQLWTFGTIIQGISLLISFKSLDKGYNLTKVSFLYSVILGISIISIFYLKVFPDCYIEGIGFTYFKLIMGYINCIILVIGLVYLRKKSLGRLNKTDRILSFSIISNITCELLFLSSSDTFDLFSVLAHIFQLLSFYYIYISLVQSSLQDPHYSLIELNSVLTDKNQSLERLVNKLQLGHDQKRKIEDERERKKQILNGILESVLDGIIVIDDNNKVAHVNNQFIKMFNIPLEITSETNNYEIIYFVKNQIKYPENFYKKVKEGWEKEEGYIQNICLENGKIFEISSVPFTDNNIIKGRVIICRDITEKRKIEELEKQIEIRQASLEKSREFDEFKSNFFCTVSHELKTPINIILGIVQLSIMKENSLENITPFLSNKYIKMIKQNCYRLIKIANNLIDITKIDAGYTEMEIRNHNIVSVIEDITLSVADYIKSKDISLVFDTDVEEKIIACDNEKLERVMLNLLSNAIKFTDSKGKIEVNIKGDENVVSISVKDSGIGIPEDKVDIVFDRFRQVDPTLTREKEGSGIGLSLVKSIVEKHGGKISLISEIGKGSEFIIELPVNLVMDKSNVDEVAISKNINVERIKIEFSDIYELNVY